MQQETVPGCRGSELATRGIRVRVSPSFVPEQSDPVQNRHVFAYRVRIVNETPRNVQLLSREWRIVDADGECNIVRGEGVVGQQPKLAPGAAFEYSSFCPLTTSWGTMEGRYTFRDENGDQFEVPIARFYLVAPPP